MNNKANKVVGIVLYSIAGILLIYAVWALIHSMGYIGELINSGQLAFAGNEYDIVSFYMSACMQYAVFAIILFALGWMTQKNSTVRQEVLLDTLGHTPSDNIKKEADGDDFSDWFDESGESEEK